MLHLPAGSVFVLVGVLWGVTNPLIRRGVLIASRKKLNATGLPSFFTGLPLLDSLLLHALTPAFILPQFVNFGGSALFAASLGLGSVSIAVPLANGVSLATNAAVDHLLGDTLSLWPGLLGLVLVLVGSTLCTLSTAAAA